MERWRINLYTLWITQIFSMVGFGICVPFASYYLQSLGVTDPVSLNFYSGLIYTLPAATMAIAAPVWGMLSDRHGRKVMIVRAMACAAVLLTLMGFCRNVGQFVFLRGLQGIFTGTVTASMSFISAYTPLDKQSYAIGLMTSSNFLGYSIGPLLGGLVADAFSYRSCFMTGGITLAIGCVLVVLLVKEERESSLTAGEKKEETGKIGRSYKKALLKPFIVMLMCALLFQRIARTVFTPYLALFVQDAIGTLDKAATYTGFINGAVGVATALSAVTLARLGDRFDRMKLIKFLSLISIPMTLILGLPRSLVIFTIFYTLYFLVAGAIEPILTSAASSQVPAEMRGTLFGIMCTINSVGSMISPMIGAGISIAYSIKVILYTMPLFTILQFICLMFNRKADRGPRFDLKKELK